MADKISVNSATRLSEAISKLTEMYRSHKFVVVSLRPGKDRTLDQNRLWFAFYKRISEMTQIGDVSDARRYCKLHHGVTILLNSDPDFQAAWYRVMRHLSYEEKLEMMGDCKLFGPDGRHRMTLLTVQTVDTDPGSAAGRIQAWHAGTLEHPIQ